MTRSSFAASSLFLAVFLTSACTTVQQQEMYAGSLPRPEQIIVFDFAVTPEDVTVDSGLSARAARGISGKSTDEKQDEDARKVANVLAKKLVQRISDMGLPAVHESDPAIAGSAVNLLVRGSFVSVDVAGHLLVSAAVTAGAQTASEAFGSNIEADTARDAKHAAELMKQFFVRQGWIED